MGLFGGRNNQDKAPDSASRPTKRQLPGRKVYCRVCDTEQTFSIVWVRVEPVTTCHACRTPFANPAALYDLVPPACPQCGEYLEHPGFEYGFCDVCHSKYEVMPGTKPNLLPNKAQRDAMNKVGRIWKRK